MTDRINGHVAEVPPSEIALDGPGLFHLPLCTRDIAVSKHERIAVVWFHAASADQRIGVPIPIEALRELALATVDAITKDARDRPEATPSA
jgi:hypothetical protein